jgi:gliding motility-associated-like protein
MAKRICGIIIAAIICLQSVNAQLEASNWYFGFNAGLRFDPITNDVTPLTDGQLRTDEGCSTISDSQGNLLFYTDGITVYNQNHQIMQNGTGLRGDPSSTQSGIIIPKPNDPNIYYIFTVDSPFDGEVTGMHYYTVDMTLASGLGAVTTDVNNPPNLLADCSEKIAAINAQGSNDILVVAYANQSRTGSSFNTYFSFRVTDSGVDEVPIASTFSNFITNRRGYLKISPDGSKMVSANSTDGTYLYDFDNVTGIVSNERPLDLTFSNGNGYGVEFSPSNSFLYVGANNAAPAFDPPSAHTASVYQFDISSNDIDIINSSRVELFSGPGYRGALQLGIDGRIYRALSDNYPIGRPFLGVIENPDVAGTGANYRHDAIPLAGRVSRQGLPPFIQSFFALIDVENVCLGDITEFSFDTDNIPDSIEWDFGDGNTSTLESPTNVYDAPGIYEVTLTLTVSGAVRTYRTEVEIFDSPVANAIQDVFLCDIDQNGSEAFNFSEATEDMLDSQDPSTFEVQYFLSQSDADLNENFLQLPHVVNVGQQEIFARINNINNNDCFETTSFIARVFEQPIANPVDDLQACDDNFDGIETFNLDQQNDRILLSQNRSQFTLTYHLSQEDADNGSNPLPNTYRNVDPFLQTIYVRVENDNQNACADTSLSFDLIVNERPIANNFEAFQCDEDGVPDRRTDFNLSSFDASIAGGAAGVTVTYYLTQSDADAGNNELDNREYRNLVPMQEIIARVTDETTGCFNTSIVTLSVSASDAQDATLELCDDDGIQDGIQLFTLSLANATVLASAPAGVTVNYYETLDDALSERNTLPDQYRNAIAGQQRIFARAESDDGNCFGISEVQLTVNDLPQLEETDFAEYCGNDPQPLTISAGPLESPTTDFTYNWSTGETTYEIDVREGGTYTVVVTNTNGCSEDRVVTVVISEPANINDIEIINANGGTRGSATAVVTGLGDYEYRIDPNAQFQDSPFFDDLRPGFYTLTVNDRNGCGLATQEFSIIGYPRFFTPNFDSFNDRWQIDGVSGMFEADAQIYIFDRFGKLLKQISPSGPGWDGTFNGEPVPSSDYWFRVTLSDGTEFSGHFSLKR